MTVKPSSFGKDPGFGYTLFLDVIGWPRRRCGARRSPPGRIQRPALALDNYSIE
jgi:hypothetical protein